MSWFSIVYIIIATVLLLYSFRHRLDLLCVASVCYIVYSIYCIPGIGISGFYRPKLSASLYYAVFIQLLLIIVFVSLSRYLKNKRNARLTIDNKNTVENDTSNDKTLRIAFRIYTFIILTFAMVNIIPVGLSGFMAGKNTVWEETNVFYVISLYGAWPSFAYGIHRNDKVVWILSLFIELTIFFAGSRAFTTTMIVIFICEKGNELWKNRKSYMRIYFFGALGIAFLLLYRMVDKYIMAANFSGAVNVLKNPITWMIAFEFNEPRVIIANYDYSFTSGIQLPVGDVIYRIIDFVPGLTSLVGINLQYPEYYSTWLEYQVCGSTGVGGSIWGESYAMVGYFGIILSTILWLLFINKCNKHLDYHANYSYFVVALGTYWAWYINRLDYNRVAQSFKVMLFCFIIWAVIYMTLKGTMTIGRLRIKFRNNPSS